MSAKKKQTRKAANGGEVIRLNPDRKLGDTVLKRMTSVSVLTTTGGGALAVQTRNSDVTGATEFSSFQARYVTYRVLKVVWHFFPRRPVNTTTAADVPGALVVTRDPSGVVAPANTTLAWAIAHAKVFSSARPWSISNSASEEDHLLWTESSVTIPTTNRFQLYMTANSLPLTTAVGDLFIEWITEWRGSQ